MTTEPGYQHPIAEHAHVLKKYACDTSSRNQCAHSTGSTHSGAHQGLRKQHASLKAWIGTQHER